MTITTSSPWAYHIQPLPSQLVRVHSEISCQQLILRSAYPRPVGRQKETPIEVSLGRIIPLQDKRLSLSWRGIIFNVLEYEVTFALDNNLV